MKNPQQKNRVLMLAASALLGSSVMMMSCNKEDNIRPIEPAIQPIGPDYVTIGGDTANVLCVSEIMEGTYSIVYDNSEKLPIEIVNPQLNIGQHDATGGEVVYMVRVVDGMIDRQELDNCKLDVKKTGDTIEITFQGIDDQNVEINGHCKAPVESATSCTGRTIDGDDISEIHHSYVTYGYDLVRNLTDDYYHYIFSIKEGEVPLVTIISDHPLAEGTYRPGDGVEVEVTVFLCLRLVERLSDFTMNVKRNGSHYEIEVDGELEYHHYSMSYNGCIARECYIEY